MVLVVLDSNVIFFVLSDSLPALDTLTMSLNILYIVPYVEVNSA